MLERIHGTEARFGLRLHAPPQAGKELASFSQAIWGNIRWEGEVLNFKFWSIRII